MGCTGAKLLLHDRVVRHGHRRLRHQPTRRDITPQGHWAAAPDPEPTSPTRSHSRLPVLVRGRARNPRRSCRPGRHHSPRSSTHAPTPALPHASRLVLAPPRTKASSTRFIYRRHCVDVLSPARHGVASPYTPITHYMPRRGCTAAWQNLAACTISTILHRQAMMSILLHSSVGADALSVGIVGGGPSGASFAGRLREAFGSAAEITVFEAKRIWTCERARGSHGPRLRGGNRMEGPVAGSDKHTGHRKRPSCR